MVSDSCSCFLPETRSKAIDRTESARTYKTTIQSCVDIGTFSMQFVIFSFWWDFCNIRYAMEKLLLFRFASALGLPLSFDSWAKHWDKYWKQSLGLASSYQETPLLIEKPQCGYISGWCSTTGGKISRRSLARKILDGQENDAVSAKNDITRYNIQEGPEQHTGSGIWSILFWCMVCME